MASWGSYVFELCRINANQGLTAEIDWNYTSWSRRCRKILIGLVVRGAKTVVVRGKNRILTRNRKKPEMTVPISLIREAVGDDAEGKVLVLATNGHPGVSVGGGTKLGRVHHYGLDGVLTDGRLRDYAELRTYGFTAYCAGEAVEAGGALITPHQANVPVVLDGVGIMPGDYVLADGSGAVIIPGAEIDEVLLGATAVKQEDARFREQIAQERASAGESARGERER